MAITGKAVAQDVAGSKRPAAKSPAEQRIVDQVPRAIEILNGWHAHQPEPADRKLHIVVWTPSDREPAPRYQERLSGLLLDIQRFYATNMQRMGFGPRSIHLDQVDERTIRIRLVRGREPYANYDVSSGNKIRRECIPVLREAGINADQETIVIFCNMSVYDAEQGTIRQNSPYYAGGSHRNGTAWQVDSPILNVELLDERMPLVTDGQYGPISVGKYNSIFIGGVAHELGHALGLPHCKERTDEAKVFATALMGSGNRTYGDERRGEGKGSFITLAHGLRLASHPMFSGSTKGMNLPANAVLSEIKLTPTADGFDFAATVTADPPCYAVIGYMDPAGGSDYDATTCTAVPDPLGRFVLHCDALTAGKAGELRVVALQAQGSGIGDKTYAVRYEVDRQGKVDLTEATSALVLAAATKAAAAGNTAALDHELKRLETENVEEHTLAAVRSVRASFDKRPMNSPADMKGAECNLTDCTWSEAKVGWGRPQADRLPEDQPFLRAGGKLFVHGLYSHAPASYTWQLGAKWTRVTAQVGLADGHDGSVVFVVLGDGKELWRSSKVDDEKLRAVEVQVGGIRSLELRVENAGDGNSADWGLWLEPKLMHD
ncbi:MAG: NPCBM/NEW2 domain-containing protein [Pirellulales bacterium]